MEVTNREMKALLKQAMATVPAGEHLHIAAVIGLQAREIKRLRAKVRELERRTP